MKAILLIRVSTDAQDLVQQREKVVDAAIRDGFNERDLILIEDKESAVKLSEEERNGLNRLKESILKDSSIVSVYAYEISRISRQAKVVFSIRDFLIDHNIQLVILNPYFKMLKENGEMSETSNIFFGIFASMAENEGYIRKARMKRGKEKKKALGLHYTGRIPIGYTVNKNKEYIIDPNTAGLVKKIFHMYVDEDMSIRRIAIELRSQGYFLNEVVHTTERMVANIIHREYYTGSTKGYPQIITKEIFDKAQTIKKRRILISPRTPAKALCKGLMFNKDSGHMLTANTGLGSYYSKNDEGGGVSVRMNIIEPILWEYSINLHKQFYSKDYEQAIADSTKMIQLYTRKEATSWQKIREYEKQIERLEERVVLGKISSSKADELEKQISTNLNEERQRCAKINDDLERYKEQASNILDESQKQYDYSLFDLDDKIELMKKVIDKVMLSRDDDKKLHIEIYNKYNSDVTILTLKRKWRNYIIEK